MAWLFVKFCTVMFAPPEVTVGDPAVAKFIWSAVSVMAPLLEEIVLPAAVASVLVPETLVAKVMSPPAAVLVAAFTVNTPLTPCEVTLMLPAVLFVALNAPMALLTLVSVVPVPDLEVSVPPMLTAPALVIAPVMPVTA